MVLLFTPVLSWFPPNNSETVKAITLASCSIQKNIFAKFGIPNLSWSQDIGQNADGGISDF